MQHKIYTVLLRLFVRKIEMSQLVILMASLVLIYRVSGFFNHFQQIDSTTISLVSQANAQESPQENVKDTTKEADSSENLAKDKPKEHKEKSKKKKEVDSDEFDPLSIDENQVKILNALANQEKKEVNPESVVDIEKEKELLVVAQNDLAQKLSRLEKEKADFEKTRNDLTKDEKQNVQNIAKIYEGMKPAQSAEILNKLEIVAAVVLLKYMNPKKASAILAAMDVVKARTLTFEMLRNKNYEEEPPVALPPESEKPIAENEPAKAPPPVEKVS